MLDRWSKFWRPVYGPRLIAVAIIVFFGLLPSPKSAPAAPTFTHALGTELIDNDAWPLTPDLPPQLDPAKSISVEPESMRESIRSIANKTTPTSPTASEKIIAGWVPYWDMQSGMSVIDEFPGVVNEVSPFWYGIGEGGDIVNAPGAEQSDMLARLKSHELSIIPTIAAVEGPPISPILNDDAQRAAHIESIISKTRNPLYDGIDIDYENLPGSDKDIFSKFISELAARVHLEGKKLVVTVNAKTSDPGDWGGAQSHDYAALGTSADYVRVMAYDQHYRAGPPGPIAGIDWVEKVILFSLERIPPEKLVLGVPLYGYDWPDGGQAKSLVHDEAAAISITNNAPVQWDEASASSFFYYSNESGRHTVWLENKRSLEAKIDLAKKYDLAGIAAWRLGREDKSFYQELDLD